MFFWVTLVNLLLPDYHAHWAQIFLLAYSVLIQPFIKLLYLDTFVSQIIFATVTIVWKFMDLNSFLDLLFRAHALLSSNNVYFWMLNYFHFGVLGSWPAFR